MTYSPEALLKRLLARGDAVKVEAGRLVIEPASGNPVPPEWLQERELPLIAEVARLAGAEALQYLGYSAGNYDQGKRPGVTLQFRSLVDEKERYAVFNAETKRARHTKSGKRGDPLPPKQFRVRKGSAFYRFWETTGLPYRRLSDFHDYMGKLATLVLTGTLSKGERLEKKTLRPLSITCGDLSQSLKVNLPDKRPTISRQAPDNVPTRAPDKRTPQRQQPWGLQTNQATGEKNHGNTVIRGCGYTGEPLPPYTRKDISTQTTRGKKRKIPQEQTIDEWLADYEKNTREHNTLYRYSKAPES